MTTKRFFKDFQEKKVVKKNDRILVGDGDNGMTEVSQIEAVAKIINASLPDNEAFVKFKKVEESDALPLTGRGYGIKSDSFFDTISVTMFLPPPDRSQWGRIIAINNLYNPPYISESSLGKHTRIQCEQGIAESGRVYEIGEPLNRAFDLLGGVAYLQCLQSATPGNTHGGIWIILNKPLLMPVVSSSTEE